MDFLNILERSSFIRLYIKQFTLASLKLVSLCRVVTFILFLLLFFSELPFRCLLVSIASVFNYSF